MIGIKEDFYSRLRDEYIKLGKNSFLYRYMEEEKIKLFSTEKKATDGKRGGAYLQIKSYEGLFQNGEITETEYLVSLIKMLIKGDKLRLKKEFRQMLFDLVMKVEGEHVFDQCKKDSERYKKVIDVLANSEKYVNQTGEKFWENIAEQIKAELLDCALTVDIQTFLYDVGYPVNENGKIGVSRKKDRNLDLLTAYCKENQISLSNGSAGQMQTLTEEQVTEYNQLYKIMQNSDNRDAVIPVQVDTVTGAGVYIIGKNNISPKSKVYGKIKGNCCYVCFFVDGLSVEDYHGISSFSWLINDEENALCNLPDLEEALKWNLYFKADSYADFKERNGKMPKGCPETFQMFFETESNKADELYVTESELEEVKAMFI